MENHHFSWENPIGTEASAQQHPVGYVVTDFAQLYE
jgi:hypothetical protein